MVEDNLPEYRKLKIREFQNSEDEVVEDILNVVKWYCVNCGGTHHLNQYDNMECQECGYKLERL